ncbi:restriction endonuclease, partial [Campylobacter jejuni]|nr:restriction endonuclease [Campylobacter jejuni]EJV2996388.1 restriction endonuclease [Campylobacter jejuni]
LDTFKRTPRADLEINNYRLEIQSGFQGINDIKEHKVREAKNIFNDKNIKTLVIHFDLFNGQVAFVDISKIQNNDLNWITRQQMEGQSVFNIDSNYFQWLFLNKAPKFKDLSL